MGFKPTEIDRLWAETVLMAVGQRGVIAFPQGHLIYRVDHIRKEIELQNSEVLSDFDSLRLHVRIKKIFAMLNYKVIYKPGNHSNIPN